MSISKARKKEIKDFVDWVVVQPPKLDIVVTYDFVDALNEEEEAFLDSLLDEAEEKIAQGIIKLPDDYYLYGA